MKKVLFFLLVTTNVLYPQSWIKLNDIGTIITGTTASTVPVKEALSFSVNGKIYVIGSVTPASVSPVAMVWEYNPATDSWTEKANYPGSGNMRLTGFAIGNNIYVGTGYNTSNSSFYYSDFHKYRTDNNTWTPITNFPMVREGATGFSIGSKGYVCCGSASYTLNPTDLWAYDTTSNVWQQKANFPGLARINASAFTSLGKAYVGLGYNYNPSFWHADFYQYNPVSNSWSATSAFPGQGRLGAGAVSINDVGIVFCGNSGMPVLNDCYMYNASLNSWSNYITFGGSQRSNVIYGVVGNKVFAGGGNGAGGGGTFSDWWSLQTEVGIKENIYSGQTISVYQTDEFEVKIIYKSANESKRSFSIYNSEGKIVTTRTEVQNETLVKLNSAGIYMIRFDEINIKPIKFVIR